MKQRRLIGFDWLLVVGACMGLVSPALAVEEDDDQPESLDISTPLANALASASEDVRLYDEYLVMLASPYMEGRVPGSDGMERAKDYVEYHFRQYGLEPAFPSEVDGETIDFSSYRDPFPLGGVWEVKSEKLAALVAGEAMSFRPETDFVFTGLGGDGKPTAEAVFVGYSIDNGPDGWSSYGEEDDLTGKIAIMFRFEPMDEEGKSLWSDDDGWSGRAAFNNKIRAARERGAEGVLVINTPGAADERVKELTRFSGGRGSMPVMMMTPEAGEKLLSAADPEGRSLMELRQLADQGGGIVELEGMVSMNGEGERESLRAENVGGLLRGRGDLADEYIVVGGHLDHLGMGYFGSRSGPGTLHPGADDNASGSAGVMLLAKKMAATYAATPEDEPMRSILFMCFSGEESGLNGSRHYVNDPIVPLEQHVIMVNWDMIGRIQDGRVIVSGMHTGEGLGEFIQPYIDSSPLDVQTPPTMSGASDHTSFFQKQIPVLFSIIADFHGDYHTPDDVSWKINRVGAVHTVNMYHDIVLGLARNAERFEFSEGEGQQAAAPSPSINIKVRVGVMPASYDNDEPGIPIASVSPDSPAERGGMQDGDRLVRWDGQKIGSVQDWMQMLSKHEPGDEVKIGVKRDGEEVTLTLKLEARGTSG